MRVPHSLRVPASEQDLRKYGSGPCEDTPAELSPLHAPLESASADYPLEVGKYRDLVERTKSKVREAEQARIEAEERLKLYNERASRENRLYADSLRSIARSRLKSWESHLKAVRKLAVDRETALLNCAAACGAAQVKFDPDHPVPQLPAQDLLHDPAAHAANGKIPYDPEEQKHFLPIWLEYVFSAITGTMFGLSAGASGGIIELDAISHNPHPAMLCAAFGVAVTVGAGGAVKLAWRSASEACHMGAPWIGKGLLALATTLTMMAIETVVDQRGLMARAMLQQSIASLSGGSPAESGDHPLTMFLLGAVASVAYFAYFSFRGWFKERSSSKNRIVAACEKDRLDQIARVHDREEWAAVVKTGNRVLVLDSALNAEVERYRIEQGVFDAEEKRIEGKLMPILERPSEADVLISEKAIVEAEGRQAEADRYLARLMQAKPNSRSTKPERGTLLEMIKGLFLRRSTQENA